MNNSRHNPWGETNKTPLQRRTAWLAHYRFAPRLVEQGSVVAVGDGIAWISGLPSAAMDDLLLLEDGNRAVVFDLNRDLIGAVLLVETAELTSGTPVQLSHRRLSVAVGDSLTGRIIDPQGQPPDGREAYPGDIFSIHARLLERSTRVGNNGSNCSTAGKFI